MHVRRAGSLVLVGWLLLSVAEAAAPPAAQAEINYLLAEVAGSPCRFYRNGTWYDAARAVAHLREKYSNPFVAAHVASAEEFIDRVATRSSFTGIDYAIRCRSAAPIASARWFHERLVAYRLAEREPPNKQPLFKAYPPPLVPQR
jgi:hypothetical protein